jgi:hypothetical protein
MTFAQAEVIATPVILADDALKEGTND